MTPENFAYWLQGFAEIERSSPDPEQWQIIKDHLNLVFDKKTPERLIVGNLPEKECKTSTITRSNPMLPNTLMC